MGLREVGTRPEGLVVASAGKGARTHKIGFRTVPRPGLDLCVEGAMSMIRSDLLHAKQEHAVTIRTRRCMIL